MRRYIPWSHMPLEWTVQLLKENESDLRRLEKEYKKYAAQRQEKSYRSLCALFRDRFLRLCYQSECTQGVEVCFDPTGTDEECKEVIGVPFQIAPNGLELRPYLSPAGWQQEQLRIPLEHIVGIGKISLTAPVARQVHKSYAAWANTENVA